MSRTGSSWSCRTSSLFSSCSASSALSSSPSTPLYWRKRKLKEYMCKMGLHNWQHWVAWFIIFFIWAFIVVPFMIILFRIELTLQPPQEASSSSSPTFRTCTSLSATSTGATSKRQPFVSSQVLPWHWESD